MWEYQKGREHPLSIVINDAVKIFTDLGFEVVTGPELEDVWHNFDALNIPKDHPARDMQDTFWIKGHDDKVLRTHTSNVQIRYMENLTKSGGNPPFAIIVPGKIFRNEATDTTHGMQFYQLEALVIGKDISLANFKFIVEVFLKRLLGPQIEFKFVPSYYPFVEPGLDVYMKWQDQWLEVAGAGMVHPKVLENCGIDGEKWQGFAFGFGIDRLTMIKFKIPDVRFFYQGDLRLNQF